MKCEKCGNELTGGTIICRACHHNNALRGVGQWRARKTGDLSPEPKPQPEALSTPKQTFTPPRIVPRKDAPTTATNFTTGTMPTPQQAESNLLRFPAAQISDAPAAAATENAPRVAAATEAVPPAGQEPTPHWRDQLRARVREVREKRSGALTNAPATAKLTAGETKTNGATALDQNPLVQSALNRIQRATYPEPATVAARAARQANLAAAALQRTAPAPAVTPTPATRPAAPAETRAIGARDTHPLAPRSNEPATRQLAPRPAAAPASESPRPDHSRPTQEAQPQTTSVAPLLPRLHNQRPNSRTLPPRAETEVSRAPEPAFNTPRTGDSGRLPSADSFILPVTVRRTTGSLRNSGSLRAGVATTEIIEIPQTPTEPPAPPAPVARPTTKPLPEVASKPAGLWVRTIAGSCDFDAVAFAYLPLFFLYAMLKTSLGGVSFFIMVTMLAVIAFVFQLVMLLHAGRTFGMAMLKLRLVDATDERRAITRQQHCLRALAATFAFLLPPINLVVARLNPAHRSLPDLLSGTTVTATPMKTDQA